MKIKWVLSLVLPAVLLAGLAVGLSMAQEDSGAGLGSSAPISGGGSESGPATGSASETEPQAAVEDWRIAGTGLKPRSSGVEYAAAAGGGCFYASTGNSYVVFNAPVYLPQGATVQRVRMYYNDTNDTSDSIGWFTVYDLYGNLVQEWSITSMGSAGNGYNDTDPFTHTIDYGSYSYAVNWRPLDLGSDTQLCGFRIVYEGPPHGVALPILTRNVTP